MLDPGSVSGWQSRLLRQGRYEDLLALDAHVVAGDAGLGVVGEDHAPRLQLVHPGMAWADQAPLEQAAQRERDALLAKA